MWELAAINLQRLVKQLCDDAQGPTKDLLSCKPTVVAALRLALTGLLGNDAVHRSQSLLQLDKLIDEAYNHMSSLMASCCHPCWRRLYTDACVLRSLADIAYIIPPTDTIALECIARLDRAIVIAGAPGEGRLDFILDMIDKIQRAYFPSRPFDFSCLLDVVPSAHPHLLEVHPNSIPCIDPPSLTSFQHTCSMRPFILRGHIRNWPAMQEHPWSSTDYLRSVAGPGRIVPVEVGSDYRDNDWTQKLMNWDDFLATLAPGSERGHDVLYLAQHSLLMQFPALRADIIVPDYVYACLLAPADFPGYKPPGNDEQLVINAWLGPAGTISPAHTDPYFNFYAQVVGRKTVWLAPPSMSQYMYPYTPATPSATDKSYNPAANTTSPSMSNTSCVDVFATPVPGQEPEMHPDFWEKVAPNAISATLEPGDLLFFPPGWWHAMRSEEKSFSVSMWF